MLKSLGGELDAVILRFRSMFFVVGGFSFAINVLLLVPSMYMLQIYDRVLSSRNQVTLLMLTVIIVGLYVVEAALELVRSKVLVRASAALDLRLNGRVFDASFEEYLQNRGANPRQALSDLATVRQFLTGQGLFAFFDSPWTPIYLGIIFLLSPWLGLFALVAAILLLLLAFLNERLTGPLLSEAGQASATANNYAASNLRNAEVIEALGMLKDVRRRWFARHGRFLVAHATASDRAAAINAATRFLRLTTQSCILGVGAYLVIDNQLSAGGMVAASILLGRTLAPVELAIATWRGFVSARGAYARLNALLESHPERGDMLKLPRPQGAVMVENLFLGAPRGTTPILKGLSFRVEPGMVVAVIGPSAAGKSTLARGLVGVWGPQGGAIRLDGSDVYKWRKDQLGPWIGYLPQDVELFEGTIAENIARFGELDSERVVLAARRAGVHDLVLRLVQGYDTPIGEGGTSLSGGQRQRIALARALYGDPALIVLDEPSANLDEAGEAALIAALRLLKDEKRTVFVMTHRANLLGIADAVIVLLNGVIQAHGPRDAVLKALAPKPVGDALTNQRRSQEDAA